jgi:hypothetical protein
LLRVDDKRQHIRAPPDKRGGFWVWRWRFLRRRLHELRLRALIKRLIRILRQRGKRHAEQRNHVKCRARGKFRPSTKGKDIESLEFL